MSELKVKDNTYTLKPKFDQVSYLINKIVDKDLEQLEKEGVFIFPEIIKDAEDITKDQMVLQSVNESYRTTNIMGFLGHGTDRLVIESRFSKGEDDYFLRYLLERVLDLPNILELNTDAFQDSSSFNVSMFLFPYYLNSAMRKGVFKTYHDKHYNNANVKGSIDISRHIAVNTPFIGNVAYNQREFSYDNYLMNLIRHTIEFIKTKSYGNTLLYKVKEEVQSVIISTKGYEYYDRRKVIVENKKKPVQHAYYHEYRALQRLCLTILQHRKHQIGSGTRPIHGILFDGAWLWEEYVNLVIGNDFYHPQNRGGKGAQRLFDGNIGLIYPDFIGRDTNNRIIADAKYKPLDNIRSGDYLQLLAYMYRFDAKRGFYLYPESGNLEDVNLKMNKGSKYENNVEAREDISVSKYGLRVPINTNDYEEFRKLMKNSEEEFKNKLKSNPISE